MRGNIFKMKSAKIGNYFGKIWRIPSNLIKLLWKNRHKITVKIAIHFRHCRSWININSIRISHIDARPCYTRQIRATAMCLHRKCERSYISLIVFISCFPSFPTQKLQCFYAALPKEISRCTWKADWKGFDVPRNQKNLASI